MNATSILERVIGQEERSDAFRRALAAIGPYELDRSLNPGVTYYELYLAGVSVRLCNKTRRATAVVAYAEGAAPGYGPYSGTLPHGLRFGESREGVLALFAAQGGYVSSAGVLVPGPEYSLSAVFDGGGKLKSLSLYT